MRFWTLIRSDVHRLQGVDGWGQVARALVAKRPFRPLFTARLLQACPKGALFLPVKVVLLGLHAWFRWLAGMDLPHQVSLGSGIRIDHGWSVVINKASRIGSNVTLFHGVTLGQRDRVLSDGSRRTFYPVIEDNVWIGPHAIIAGARIGAGARIAGGALVTDDVPPGSLVVGNPARIVKAMVSPDVEHPVPIRGDHV